MVPRSMTTVLGGLLLTAAARPLCAQPFFMGTGNLEGNGAPAPIYSVSASGRVAAGHSYVSAWYPTEVVYWTLDEGMVSVTPGVYSGLPTGTNGNGSVVAGNLVHPELTTTEAFWWTRAGGVVAIGDLPGGEFRSGLQGVSPRGDILVGYSSSAQSGENSGEAFRWTAETGMVGLGGLPGSGSRSGARAISADGRVIVGGGPSAQGNQAFRWTPEGGMVGLGDLPGGMFRSGTSAVSADGSVVVGNSFDTDGERAFRWTAQTGMVPLDASLTNLVTQQAYGASWDGEVVVGYMEVSTEGFGAFYWTAEGGTRWLTDVLADHGVIVPEGWHLGRAYGVSADGRTIVGSGSSPEGEAGGGWVAYLGPACRADYDESGSVNTADVIAYLGAWSQRSIFADWNYDGYIDTRDVIGFLGEWVAKPGC